MELDMTKGSPAKLITKFIIPIIIGNIFQQLYSMVDTIIVGRFVGVDALAAVGATGSVSFLILGFTQGLTTGFTVLTAQRFGAGDREGMRKSIGSAAILSVIVTIVMTAVSMTGMDSLLRVMNTPEDIFDMTKEYIMIICAGIACNVLYNLLSSILRAIGNSVVPLVLLVIASVTNIVLDYVLIVYGHMGVGGAAYATIISQGLSGVLCLIYIIKSVPSLHIRPEHCRLESQCVKNQLTVGIPMALQFSITASGAMVMQAAINLFGSVAVAAFTAASKVQNLVTQGMMSMGQTMASYGGQNYGKGDYHRLEKGVRSALLISVIYSLLAAAAVGLFLRPLLSLFFSGDIDMASLMPWAKTYIYMCAVFYIPLSTIFIFRNIMQGCGYSFLPMMGGVVELFARMITALIAMKLVSFPLACFCDPAAWVGAALFTGFSWLSVKKKLRASLLPEDTSSSSEAK